MREISLFLKTKWICWLKHNFVALVYVVENLVDIQFLCKAGRCSRWVFFEEIVLSKDCHNFLQNRLSKHLCNNGEFWQSSKFGLVDKRTTIALNGLVCCVLSIVVLAFAF